MGIKLFLLCFFYIYFYQMTVYLIGRIDTKTINKLKNDGYEIIKKTQSGDPSRDFRLNAINLMKSDYYFKGAVDRMDATMRAEYAIAETMKIPHVLRKNIKKERLEMIDRLSSFCCDVMNIDKSILSGKSQYPEYVYVRSYITKKLYKKNGIPYSDLGAYFNRNHSTMIHLMDIANNVKYNKLSKSIFEKIDNNLKINEIQKIFTK